MNHWIWDDNAPSKTFKDGKGAWVPAHLYQRSSQPHKLIVINDIQPYKSVITGEVIGGRKQHRDHLRAHGCIEVGNEKLNRPKPVQRDTTIGRDIQRAMQERGIS